MNIIYFVKKKKNHDIGYILNLELIILSKVHNSKTHEFNIYHLLTYQHILRN